jgi:hypothetical protein
MSEAEYTTFEERELSFRRGFHQGYSAALDALQGGATPAILAETCDSIAEWRAQRPVDLVPPPAWPTPKPPEVQDE